MGLLLFKAKSATSVAIFRLLIILKLLKYCELLVASTLWQAESYITVMFKLSFLFRLHLTSRIFLWQVDDTNKRVNGDVDVSKKTSVPSRYHQFMTSEDEAQSNSAHSSEEEEEAQKEEEEEQRTKAESVPSTRSVSSIMPRVTSEAPVASAPVKDTSKVIT